MIEKGLVPRTPAIDAEIVIDWDMHYKFIKEHDFPDWYDNRPSGAIQWKGTNVCMDTICSCGHRGHVDTEFFYYYVCSKCKRLYAVGCVVKLTELPKEHRDYVLRERDGVIHSDDEGTPNDSPCTLEFPGPREDKP